MSYRQDEWERYLDEETNCYYWYSHVTGETQWDDGENSEYNQQEIALAGSEGENDPEGEDVVAQSESSFLSQTVHRARSKTDTNYSTEEALSDDVTCENDVLIEAMVSREVYQRTENAITAFTYCFIAHAVLIEAPLACVEGCVRGIVGLFLVVLMFFVAILLGGLSWFDRPCLDKERVGATCRLLLGRMIALSVENILSWAAALSMAVPFMILVIYREFNGVDDWNLKPIPTVLGWVDPRRFAVITLGQGSSASNVELKCSDTELIPKTMDTIPLNRNIDPSAVCFPRQILQLLAAWRR